MENIAVEPIYISYAGSYNFVEMKIVTVEPRTIVEVGRSNVSDGYYITAVDCFKHAVNLFNNAVDIFINADRY